MSKIIASIVLLTLLSQSFSKMCGVNTGINCPDNYGTCCRTPAGWQCVPGVSRVCCSDGTFSCDKGQICNINAHRCEDKPSLTFLAVEEYKVIGTLETLETTTQGQDLQLSPEDAVQLMKGFSEGFGFFYNLPHQDECQTQDQQMAQDVIAIVNILKKITSAAQIPAVIKDILPYVLDGYTAYNKLAQSCPAWGAEVKKVEDKLQAYVSEKTYVEKLSLHTLVNASAIVSQIKTATATVEGQQYQNGGKDFGAVAKFIFFWGVSS
jgi:hypothetical protein